MKRSLVFVAIALLTCLSANAQGNKTYVSYRGADTNACSRVLPCRTVNHALSVIAPGFAGTVDIIDSGDYDAFTINQGVTVIADPGVLATIGCSACNAITVNSGSSVILRNLHLNGLDQTSTGVLINSKGTVSLQQMHIERFQIGIDFGAGRLDMSDTTVDDNWIGLNSDGGGNVNRPVGSFTGSRFVNNWQEGVSLANGGPYVFDKCSIIGNQTGIQTRSATTFLSNSTITQNNTGVEVIGRSVSTFGNNKIGANTFVDVDTQSGGQFTLISTR